VSLGLQARYQPMIRQPPNFNWKSTGNCSSQNLILSASEAIHNPQRKEDIILAVNGASSLLFSINSTKSPRHLA